jgi:hypothetical protein
MTNNTHLTRTQLLDRSFDGVPEMITGRLQGPWVVRAGACDHCPGIRVTIFGGEWSSSGVNIGDQSVTLAGDDWRPLVTEAVTEMRRRTGRPISVDCTLILGVDVDDVEFEAVAGEAIDILFALADGPPPTPVH